MGFLKELDKIRRNFMKGLTRGIGSTRPKNFDGRTNNIRRILISRPNGRLGNSILITPVVQEAIRMFPSAKIDLFVKGNHAATIFKNYRNVDRIISLPAKPFRSLGNYLLKWITLSVRKYDLAINVDKGSSSGRISTKIVSAPFKIFGNSDTDEALPPDSVHMAKQPVYNLRRFIDQSHFECGKIPSPNMLLSADESSSGKKLLQNLTGNNRATIGIYTFATGKKQFSTDWWANVYERLKVEFPEHIIVEVLPVENVSQINFAATSYYSKNIREIAAVIGAMDVFVCADSGIMHLGSASQTPTVGLFSATSVEKYAPYNSGSRVFDARLDSEDDLFSSLHQILKKRPLTEPDII